MNPPLLSLVITMYNEEDNVQPLLVKINKALQDFSYEVILVDDGSKDETVNRIKLFSGENVKLLMLNKNYGQTTAMAAGIDHARGDYIVTLDGDLQNDPDDIPRMVALMQEGDWDVIAGNRVKRKDGFLLRKIPSILANAIIRKATDVHLKDYGCSLKIFKREVAKGLGLYGELHRFIPVLAQMNGARITEMDVKHHPRVYGKSKYGLGRTFKVISDLLLMVFFQKYLQKPMHLFGTAGILIFLTGGLISVYLLIDKFILGNELAGRPILFVAVLALLGGIQLITIGFVAEMIVRTYFESQDKKTYRLRGIYRGEKKLEKST